ncbi:dethiobiotin synthase [Pantoea latae]|uniref:ATP-dependent dethiobiotin synthetase BioD n=1 Tax=Pantoea latae TaxID=1964541 RepID=A0A1V9DMX3_9GAMM|nr:dethiobiotin synthase [Pantoea latae]OQP35202.1 dethiobiotin synthase [Pantoea latae]
MKNLFITGTDTAVGKTVVSRALLQYFARAGLSAVGFKPVARNAVQSAEGLRSKDALVLQSSSTLALPYDAINPLIYEEDEVSTRPREPVDYALLSRGLQQLEQQAECVIVEGTGGWRSLMHDAKPLSGWVAQHQIPVVLVVGIKQGCLSHALLTAEAIKRDGLPLAGWVANRINPGLAHYAELIAVLSDSVDAPLLGELPYLPRAEQRELSGYLDLSPLGVAAVPSSGAKIA